MEIAYVNSNGVRVPLNAKPYRIYTGTTLFDYEWDAIESGSTGDIAIRKLKRLSREMTIKVTGSSHDELKANIRYLTEVFEADTSANAPGRFYWGDGYLKCWVSASHKTEPFGELMARITVMLTCKDTQWSYDTTTNYIAQVDDETGLDFAYDYEHDYAASHGSAMLVNSAYAPSDFQMVIYGPCTNPAVTIGDHVYRVYATLETGEYLVIDSESVKVDSKTMRCYKVGQTGAVTNQYSLRDKESYLFTKIPAGSHVVSWNMDFDFDVTVREKRSEPKWI